MRACFVIMLTLSPRFDNLGLKLKTNGKQVLAGVTGEILHGRVTAVMGPSVSFRHAHKPVTSTVLQGAGKTTFLSTLSGKAAYGSQTGDIFLNGKKEPLSKYRRLVGFVPQEDVR